MNGAVRPLLGTFYRCVSRKRDPLSAEGARLRGGRYNRIGEAALYLADDPRLAVEEHLQLGREFEVLRFNPRLLVSVEVQLESVLDVTDESTRESLGVTLDDLVAKRGTTDELISQELGTEARRAGLEALLVPSTCLEGRSNLVIFPENRRAASRLEVVGMDDYLGETAPA